jgi:hypothetical protein
MQSIRNLSLVLVSAGALFAVACGGTKVVVVPSAAGPAPSNLVAAAPAQVVVTTVPATPALPEDVVAGSSPGADYVWVRGYYKWLGDHYVWVPGTYVRVPRPSAVWVPGQWQTTSGGYTWVPGHWQ